MCVVVEIVLWSAGGLDTIFGLLSLTTDASTDLVDLSGHVSLKKISSALLLEEIPPKKLKLYSDIWVVRSCEIGLF